MRTEEIEQAVSDLKEKIKEVMNIKKDKEINPVELLKEIEKGIGEDIRKIKKIAKEDPASYSKALAKIKDQKRKEGAGIRTLRMKKNADEQREKILNKNVKKR